MQTKIKDLGKLKRQISVTIPEKEMENASYKVYQNLKNKLLVKGFRKGKFPKNLMEKRFQEDVEIEIKKNIIPDKLTKIIKAQSLKVATQPKVDAGKFEKNKPFSFTAEFELFPNFKLPVWREIVKIKNDKTKLSEKEIENYILLTTLQNYDYQEKTTPVENTDKVEIKLNFQEIAGKKEERKLNIIYYVGSNEIAADLDKALLKMDKGGKKKLNFTVSPYSLSQDIAGKTVKIDIEIVSIAKKLEATQNKDFFQKINPDVTDQTTLYEFCKKSLENMRKTQTENKQMLTTREAIIKNVDFDVPEEFIESSIKRLEQKQPENKQNTTQLRKSVIDALRLQFVLAKIIEEQKITVSSEELGKAIAKIALSYNIPPADLMASEHGKSLVNNIRNQLEEQKSLEFILKNAQKI